MESLRELRRSGGQKPQSSAGPAPKPSQTTSCGLRCQSVSHLATRPRSVNEGNGILRWWIIYSVLWRLISDKRALPSDHRIGSAGTSLSSIALTNRVLAGGSVVTSVGGVESRGGFGAEVLCQDGHLYTGWAYQWRPS